MRARLQGELVDRLTSIDAIDRRITAALDELAGAIRPREALDDALPVGDRSPGVRAAG